MSSPAPTELFHEALNAFSQSTQKAFAAIDASAKAEVARVNAELRQLRLERDKAVDALHKCQLDSESWKQEAATCQANLKQADLKITHQTETIAQLRREANQWKDQSRNWQEHFLRVEQERCSLSTRIEELVTQTLQKKQRATTSSSTDQCISKEVEVSSYKPPSYKSAVPVTPFEPESPSVASTSTNHQRRKSIIQPNHPVSSPARTLPPYEPSSSTTASAPVRNQLAPAKRRRIEPQEPISSPPPRAEPRQTLIRRVHAVVNLKTEPGADEESLLSESQGQAGRHTSSSRPGRSARRKSAYILEDDSESGEGDDDDYVQEEEEEDELLIGAEPNHKELHSRKRLGSTKGAQDISASASKKRKHDTLQKSTATTTVRRRA